MTPPLPGRQIYYTAVVAVDGPRALASAGLFEARGRETLHKYFPDVEAILHACHKRQVTGHLHDLVTFRGSPVPARLEAMVARTPGSATTENATAPDVGALLHRGQDVDRAQQQILDLVEAC